MQPKSSVESLNNTTNGLKVRIKIQIYKQLVATYDIFWQSAEWREIKGGGGGGGFNFNPFTVPANRVDELLLGCGEVVVVVHHWSLIPKLCPSIISLR